MPDINGNYNGDRSGVLPSNTAAMLHFSDQFAQMAAQKRAQQAAQQREDQQMRNRVNSAISSHIFNPNFLKTDGSNPQMQGLMSEYANDALNKLKNEGEQSAYQYIYDKAGELGKYNQILKQAHANVVNAAEGYTKSDPMINKAALTNLLATAAFSKTDENGNIIPKDLSEIDPTQNYLPQILKEHGQDLYSEETSKDALTKDVKALATDNPKVPSNIDNKGNIISTGYSAKNFPSYLMDVVPDGKGGFTAQTKAQNFSLDGKNPYVDQNGQYVKVLPPEVADFFSNNNAIHAKAERATRQQLGEVNAAGQQIDRDSPYGEMLYQKNLYDFVNGGLNGRFSVNADDAGKQAKAIKDKNFSQGIQQAHLEISKRNANRGEQEFQYRKDKDAGKLTDANGNAVESRFDDLVNNAFTVPGNAFYGGDTKYVDVSGMDRDEYNQLTGGKAKTVTDALGNTTTTYGAGVAPYEVNGKKVLILNDKTGTLEGKDGTVTKEAADTRQIKAIPKNKKTVIQRAKAAVQKVVKNFKGTEKSLY